MAGRGPTILALAAALAAGLAAASTVRAANVPDSRLDAVASALTRQPVAVMCESDQDAWQATLAQHGVAAPAGEPQPAAFDVPAGAGRTVWLGPDVCLSLRYYLHDAAPAKLVQSQEEALMTLLTEAEMVAGHSGTAAECAALGQLRLYLTRLYGIPATVTKTVTVTTRDRHGKAGKIKVKKAFSNPKLQQIVAAAQIVRPECGEPSP